MSDHTAIEPPYKLSFHGHLFQARVWREYAMAWDGITTSITGVGREWVENVLQVPREECLRRSKGNVLAARALNSGATP